MDQSNSLACTNPVCFAEKKSFVKEEAIDVMGQLCCPSCQQPLEDPIITARKKAEIIRAKQKKIIILIASIVLLISSLVFFFVNRKPDEKLLTDATTTRLDTVVTAPVNPPVVEEPPVVKPEPQVDEPEPVAEPKPKKSNVVGGSTSGGKQTIKLEGGNTYKGELLKGKPHGMGTMYYKSAVQISQKDLKKRMSEPGDYLIGEFFEGKLVQGKLYDSDNNVKEVIMIGR